MQQYDNVEKLYPLFDSYHRFTDTRMFCFSIQSLPNVETKLDDADSHGSQIGRSIQASMVATENSR